MSTTKQHTSLTSIILHLLPGILGTIVYILLTPTILANGYPAILSILIAAGVIILPTLLGILLYEARRINESFSLKEVVLYREPLPKWQYIVIPLALIIWGMLASGATGLLDQAIAMRWFTWMPDWFFIFELSQFEGYTQNALILTFIVGLIINGITLPLVEELYFRGYLLPRIERFGRWAPFFNVSLFSLYHFWSPWQVISRIVWLFPWVYTSWRKRNIYLMILAHCGANTIGWLLTWGLIFGQT